MISGKQSPLIGPNQLINSIDSFSEAVTNYLSPVVRFVGHKDKYYECLYRKYPDLQQEKRYSGKPAHLVVFDETPQDKHADEAILTADSVYVMCLAHNTQPAPGINSLFRNRVSATLYDPTVDELYWHTKALLMIQDISFSNGLHSYPELMSVDVTFRKALSQLVLSTINFTSCVICVSSTDVSNALESFLFASLPSVLSPFKACVHDLDVNRLPSDRITNIISECESQQHLERVMAEISVAVLEKPVIAILVVDEIIYNKTNSSLDSLYLGNLNNRTVDAQLIAYWCSMYMSASYGKPKYFSHDQVITALELSSYESSNFIDALSLEIPELDAPNASFIDLVTKYDRPTIDDIFDEAEQRVMEKLRVRATITDAASCAAGIPTVTFRKRMKRLLEKETFLGLISNQSDAQ